ncbi:PadR family transcriptional regulator [Knoellia subterranea]|uniref:PadR family transcriptional regulator n=1 Tax=Knoellia subterranea KCTC 19937 TaxID=1385521 RepID=A0A0A0JKB7_9MICO|nr:PadR family transcriptional regulator [Knoellia subterranea]KGN37890.1 PadR family transcriptional regulator [Knoellia subterranea KCTC 19937]
MSVKQGLMALLAQAPMYGAQLRSEFEERTGGTWPLNVGQVYTTLARLERDGLVEPVGEPDAEGRISYRLTDAGKAEVGTWWSTPVDRDNTPRDELTIKLALAVTVPGVDVQAVAQTQRTATLRQLHDLTRLKQDVLRKQRAAESGAAPSEAPAANEGDEAGRDGNHDLAWLLVLENLIFTAEAEVRWLDHVETRLHRESLRPFRRSSAGETAAEATARVEAEETAYRLEDEGQPQTGRAGARR